MKKEYSEQDHLDCFQSYHTPSAYHSSFLEIFPFTFHFYALEEEMATHSSVLAWRIPGIGEPGGLPSMGHTESDTTVVTYQ